MNKILLTFLFLVFVKVVSAQTISIPDNQLKQVLIGCKCADLDGDNVYDDIIDTNDDNEISKSEAEAVLGLKLLSFDIVNPEGLQFFTNLTYLRLGNNDIETFDLLPFTKLQRFDCSSNEFSQLDLNNSLELVELDCSGNEIEAIDVSMLTKLEILDLGGNMISSLDLRANRSLSKIVLGANLFTELTINDFPLLSDLSILPNPLDRIEVSNNPSLQELKLRGRPFQNDELLDIVITGNEKLESVILELLVLKKLDLSNNDITNLEHYSETTLEYFDISDNVNFDIPFLYREVLDYIDVENTALTGIQIFGDVEYYNFNTNVPISVNISRLENDLSIRDQVSIENLNVKFDDRSVVHDVEFLNIPNLKSLKISGKVADLDLVDFAKLEVLEVDAISINLERVGLRNFGYSNFVTDDIIVSDYLKIADCDSMKSIYFRGSTQTVIFNSLDNLNELFVTDAEINNLTISSCTSPNLELRSSSITTAQVIDSELSRMQVFAGTIGDLDIDNNQGLVTLNTRSTKLGTLDITNNPDLNKYEMAKHSVDELNLKGLNKLKELLTNDIDLDSMYVQDLPSLEVITDELNTTTRSLFIENLPRLRSLVLLSRHVNPDSIHGINLEDFPSLDSLRAIGRNEIRLCNLNELSYLRLTAYDEQVIDLSSCPNIKEISLGDIGDNKRLNLANGTNLIESIDIKNSIDTICVDNVEEENRIKELVALDFVYSLSCAVDENDCGTSGSTLNSVVGKVLSDTGLGCMSLGEEGIYTLPIRIESPSFDGFIYPNKLNEYIWTSTVPDDFVTLVPIIDNDYYSIEPNQVSISFTGIGERIEQSFCLKPNGQFTDVDIYILPLDEPRPGLVSRYIITIKNIGTTSFTGPVDFNFDGSVLTFQSASQRPNSEGSSVLNWIIEDLLPLTEREIEVSFLLNKPSDTPALLGGEILKFQAEVIEEEGDDLTNNLFDLNQTVVNSLDPNDKKCLIGEELKFEDKSDYLYYQIRFENIGTADAIDVEVIDEIDTLAFDPSTFQPIKESHLAKISIENNIIRYRFEDINLSSVEGENKGYVLFRIKAKDEKTFGDRLENSAQIFFDFNEAIKTNTYSTLILDVASSTSDNIPEQMLKVFPNPVLAGNDFKIEVQGSELHTFSIYSSTGELVKRLMTKSNIEVSTIDFTRGLYFLELKNQKKRFIEKLVVF